MRATGTSNTVTKGDGNSRAVGSKRRDREDVICRRPVRPKTCQKKKKVIATFRIPEARMRATGTSNTVTKGHGNSRPVGSKRRDREDVVDVAVKTCPARKLVHT